MPLSILPLKSLETLATDRNESLLTNDLTKYQDILSSSYQGRRIAIIGAAGSIGSAVLTELLRYEPSEVVLFDLNENGLVEVVRELRSSNIYQKLPTIEAIPIGMGTIEFLRYFSEQPKFDIVFNMAALKHVRSEKNVYSLIRMLDTNCLFVSDLMERMAEHKGIKFFSVSSDKAVNPASLMGASKLAMERVMAISEIPYATARFANVAFSEGSLPHGFLRRLQKGQPLSAPNDILRYFISHEEAGQLCVLAAGTMDKGETLVPRLDPVRNTRRFDDIAARLLRAHGYEPVECYSEEEARASAAELIASGRWPCFFSASDTSGEKPYEEFYDETSQVEDERFEAVKVVSPPALSLEDRYAVERFLTYLRTAKNDPMQTVDDYAAELAHVVPGFRHIRTGRTLDQKM
jgi:FlaA1/EpsC-like NDP-sugar epimerase